MVKIKRLNPNHNQFEPLNVSIERIKISLAFDFEQTASHGTLLSPFYPQITQINLENLRNLWMESLIGRHSVSGELLRFARLPYNSQFLKGNK